MSKTYSEIRCIALCVLQTSKDFWFFMFSQSSQWALGNTCLLVQVQKVMVCDSWLVDFDPFSELPTLEWRRCWEYLVGLYQEGSKIMVQKILGRLVNCLMTGKPSQFFEELSQETMKGQTPHRSGDLFHLYEILFPQPAFQPPPPCF